jgi:SLT domain-containing protein
MANSLSKIIELYRIYWWIYWIGGIIELYRIYWGKTVHSHIFITIGERQYTVIPSLQQGKDGTQPYLHYNRGKTVHSHIFITIGETQYTAIPSLQRGKHSTQPYHHYNRGNTVHGHTFITTGERQYNFRILWVGSSPIKQIWRQMVKLRNQPTYMIEI